ncbi:AAA family ATPase [Candidatus Woesearchaeota archaeon]|nr:AAA family ATPase [Candidatus Woesearchaeota archaeon]
MANLGNLKDNMKKNGMVLMKVPETKITEKEYFVPPRQKRDLDEVVATIKNIKKFGKEMGNRNYLFIGPPGVGKTLGMNYIRTALEGELYDGKTISTPQAVLQAFAEARNLRDSAKGKPIMIIINEIDKFSSRAESIDPNQLQTLNALLDEMQGNEDNNGIFIFGTSNRPNHIDVALRRPGRFGAEVEFFPPTREGRYKILQMHAEGRGGHEFKVNSDDLNLAADKTFGFTGGDLVGLLNKAFVSAVMENRTQVSKADVEHALKKQKPSAIKDMPFVEPAVKLLDLVGYEDHKAVLRNVLDNTNESVVLLYGPAGTGKTMFPEALAGEYGYNLIMLRGSELESKWVGESKDKVKEVIERAKQLSPCLLVMDEIESFVEQKGWTSHKDSQTGYLQSVLSRPPEGVYIFATTNNPEFLRGPFRERFIHKIFFPNPTEQEQLLLWKKYAPEADAEALVMVRSDLSCRSIAHACQKLKDYGIEQNSDVLSKVITSLPKPKEEKDWKEVLTEVGDGIQEYRALKEFVPVGAKA